MGDLLFHIKGNLASSSWKYMKLEELNFLKRKTISSILSPDEKREMREWASSNGTVVQQRSERNYNGKERNFVRRWILRRAQTNHWCSKEYSDERKSDSEILQYDSTDSVESEGSDSQESLNVGRVFETSNENKLLIGHSSRFDRSVKFSWRFLYWFYQYIFWRYFLWKLHSCKS